LQTNPTRNFVVSKTQFPNQPSASPFFHKLTVTTDCQQFDQLLFILLTAAGNLAAVGWRLACRRFSAACFYCSIRQSTAAGGSRIRVHPSFHASSPTPSTPSIAIDRIDGEEFGFDLSCWLDWRMCGNRKEERAGQRTREGGRN